MIGAEKEKSPRLLSLVKHQVLSLEVEEPFIATEQDSNSISRLHIFWCLLFQDYISRRIQQKFIYKFNSCNHLPKLTASLTHFMFNMTLKVLSKESLCLSNGFLIMR